LLETNFEGILVVHVSGSGIHAHRYAALKQKMSREEEKRKEDRGKLEA
jgi:hypothetical protein